LLGSPERDQVILTVEDNGPGVPEEQWEHIFERFARVDSDRNRTTGGIGLGLAVAKGIVTRHGGQITVNDASLGGARFTVTLPTAE
jgi:two-component system, OmpR family, sensor histidine kinase RstB